MKFGPRELRFTYPVWASFRGLVVLVGRRNTLHLQETALVIEGDLLRFQLPIIDRFVRRVFCEWTMVTVPYSRIVRHKYCTYRTAKVLWWLLVAAAAGFLGFVLATLPKKEPAALAALMLVLVVLGLLLHFVLRPRHVLTFRGADGKRRLVCFRFTGRPQRNQFICLLTANLDAVRALPAASPQGPVKVRSAP
jgi:hypothetical protein